MKYAIETLGCKVNQFETQAMEALLISRGHISTSGGDADVVIVNTCAVTGESERKSRQALRSLRRENPKAFAALCGCASQTSPHDARKLGADVIYGTGDRIKFVDDIEKLVSDRRKTENIDDPFRRTVFETLAPGAIDGRTRAYIKIQDGCDNFCTYCVIPYARGRVRSLGIEEASNQAKSLVSQGFREIVITGIEISSYGKDFRNGERLCDVICEIAKSAEDARIRLGSLEPRVITEEFCQSLAEMGNICPHFHLSLQSGCDKTLKDMGRKYDTARFFESTKLLRRYFSNCALTADLIVGFPGESEGDFEETLDFINKCAFSSMHIFPYSKRKGTPAADRVDQIEKSEKSARAKRARLISDQNSMAYLHSCIGKTLCVLFENESYGHSENYCKILAVNGATRGEMAKVLVTGAKKDTLIGEKLD